MAAVSVTGFGFGTANQNKQVVNTKLGIRPRVMRAARGARGDGMPARNHHKISRRLWRRRPRPRPLRPIKNRKSQPGAYRFLYFYPSVTYPLSVAIDRIYIRSRYRHFRFFMSTYRCDRLYTQLLLLLSLLYC